MTRIAIIGGGISGLSVAWRLRHKLPDAQITVLEKESRPGGTLWTLRRDGFQLETGANGFLDNKPSTLELCGDLGLKTRLVTASEAASKNRYLFLDGKLQALPDTLWAFLRTGLLSWRGKLGLLTERFRRSRPAGPDESIAAFAQRRAGREVAEVLADAVVTGIYAGDLEELSLPACFPRIAAMEREHGSVLRGLAQAARQRRLEARQDQQPYRRPGMWSCAGGLRVLVEALQERCQPHLGIRVRRLTREGDPVRPTWLVQGEGRDCWRADAVVLTCPAPLQAELLADLDAELAGHTAQIAYNAVVVIGLGYRRADVPGTLDGFGFIAPQRTRRDVLGVQWCSSIFPGRAPEGAVLLRALCGGSHRADMVTWSDDRLLEAVRGELRQAMGISAAPFFGEIIRWERAIPQYRLGHLDNVAWLEEGCRAHPGLFLGGNAYRGVSLNDCTERAAFLAQEVQTYLRPV